MSPILFYAPEVHLKGLERIYIDEVIKSNHWKNFIVKLEEDWVEYVLYVSFPYFHKQFLLLRRSQKEHSHVGDCAPYRGRLVSCDPQCPTGVGQQLGTRP